MDLIETLILAINPYIVGNFIDEVLKGKYFYLKTLIALEIIYGILHTINIWLDTHVYSKIIEEEHDSYYKEFCSTEVNDSVISSRLELVDDVPIFLEFDAFQLIKIIISFIISLFLLIFEIGIGIFIFSLIITILIPIITYAYQSKVEINNNNYKILNDERIKCICSRNPNTYNNFIHKVLNIKIENSDIETKIFLITYILQTILLFVAIFTVINSKKFTGGLLISTIGYIADLNSCSSEFNYNILRIKDLKGSVSLLKNKF